MMFVAERDVETHIWKTVYYQVIEMLKSSFLDTENTSTENRKKLKSCLLNLFDEGVDYYTQLLTDLSSTYRFDVTQGHILLILHCPDLILISTTTLWSQGTQAERGSPRWASSRLRNAISVSETWPGTGNR